ncbi:SCA7-domain-containing protein [Martensiomyces pterosporus]|nr:SCA7-domain-containing protein [Martensiomyces pterosporus]
MATSLNSLTVFGQPSDWRKIPQSTAQRLVPPPRLTWDMLKKAVAEEDKYQSKKNWSSTKGRGNRKAPVARRLDAEVLKKFGVYPDMQFLTLATCDSCGKQVNAHYLKEHQETNCLVSSPKREDRRAMVAKAKEKEKEEKRDRDREKEAKKEKERLKAKEPVASANSIAGVKRLASESLTDDGEAGDGDGRSAKSPKMTKKARLKLEKEKREKEKMERKEQQRLEKERKKKEKELKREKDLAKAKLPLDLDKQCGVVAEPGAQPCTRSLTCKTHSMAMKRAVHGRSQLFDALLQAHLAKSRSAAAAKNAAARSAAAKSSNAAAVRNATAIALGGEAGALDESFFEESDDHDSDSEAELVIGGVGCSHGKPMATRPTLVPRRRHHYLRVRDLFYDALKPSMTSDASDPLAIASNSATAQT